MQKKSNRKSTKWQQPNNKAAKIVKVRPKKDQKRSKKWQYDNFLCYCLRTHQTKQSPFIPLPLYYENLNFFIFSNSLCFIWNFDKESSTAPVSLSIVATRLHLHHCSVWNMQEPGVALLAYVCVCECVCLRGIRNSTHEPNRWKTRQDSGDPRYHGNASGNFQPWRAGTGPPQR